MYQALSFLVFMSSIRSNRLPVLAKWLAHSVAIGIALAPVTACGDDSSGSTIQPFPTAPVINLINPPTVLRLGQASGFFPVEVTASDGIRASRFFEIEIFRPNGSLFRTNVFDAATAGCVGGATRCSFQSTVQVDSGNPTGRYQIRYTAFDQQNRQNSITTLVDVVN